MLVKLRDIAKISVNNYKNSDNWKVFRYLDTSNITDNKINQITTYFEVNELPSRAKQKVAIGNIIFSSVRPTQRHFGYIEYDIENLLVSTGFIVLIPKVELVDGKYLYYFLSQQKIVDYLQDIAQSSKSSYPSITNEDILNLTINLPTLEKQKRIASILTEIDNQIDRNNSMVKKLQVLSQAIFNVFFSNENDSVSLLDFPYIRILKPGIAKFDGQKHYIATAEIEGDKINFDASLISYETRENRANMQPVKNSIWFAKMKNSVKHLFISKEDNLLLNNYILSTGFCGIECDAFVFEYMINYIKLPYFEKKKNILSHGATMEGVNNDDLKLIRIHLPSKEKLIAFHNKTKQIHCYISKINQITHELNSKKQIILPLLINGQLT